MPNKYLKRSKPETERSQDDAKVRATVSATLADIEARGDTAVRELAIRFDGYGRDSYRLSKAEIEVPVAKVSPRDLKDIRFAHDQVVDFAKAQRASMTDVEVETLPTRKAGRCTGGLSVGKYLKTHSDQRVVMDKAATLVGQHGSRLCMLECFFGHAEPCNLRVRRSGRIDVPCGAAAE